MIGAQVRVAELRARAVRHLDLLNTLADGAVITVEFDRIGDNWRGGSKVTGPLCTREFEGAPYRFVGDSLVSYTTPDARHATGCLDIASIEVTP